MDDDYVAQLMAKEAAENSKKYSLEGLGAYQSQKRSANAPKANTRFLRHLIKETDNHNTALKRKEERDAGDRMRQLKDQGSPREPRTDPTGTIVDMTVDAMASAVTRVVPTGKATAIVVVRHPRAGTETGIGIGTADIGEETTTAVDHEIPIEIESAGHDGETTIEIDQGGEVETKSTETVTGQRLTEGEDPQSLAAAPHVEIEVLNLTAAGVIINLLPMPGHPRRAGKRSDGRGVTRIPDLHTSQNTQHLSIQSRRLITNPNLRSNDMTGKNQTLLKIWLALFRLRRTENPLHRFVRVAGAPTKLARTPCRGPRNGEDDWDMALEALRDRARWKQKGEERLREAGLNETIIERWKDNTTSTGASGEKRPEDVRWSKKGEGREWDRGKVVDDQGHTDVHALW
ncbi:hypothetical protein N7509_005024 [Penicillium cosmopolitanum]|uniref:Uncharacterized protein n=1 Tax=Penicillium cosmopolitanum TaxID=1131564 RepID=A0A9W9W1S3_9EURO|nr:uncharacterized protein N7509_005024 [Penicillium cosmopolitanum]KAJ5396911.1 hypothetical protein N7509_005024 [Penicillium cosmopolitanum]